MNGKAVRTKLLIGKLSKMFVNEPVKAPLNICHLKARKVLVVAPHADDEVIGCGAMISHYVRLGVPVCVLIVTQESSRSIARSYQYEPAERVAESFRAKDVLGYNELHYFDYPELKLGADVALQERYREDLTAFLTAYDADQIFIPNSDEMHPDHQIIGNLSKRAIMTAKSKEQLPGLNALFTYEIWGPVALNAYAEISVRDYNKKIESIQCYASQTCSVDYEQIIDFLAHTRGKHLGIASETADRCGLAEGYLFMNEDEILNMK